MSALWTVLGSLVFALGAYALWVLAKLLYWRLRARGKSRLLCSRCGLPYDMVATADCWAVSGVDVIDRFICAHGVLCEEHALELREQLIRERCLSDAQVIKADKEARRLLHHLIPRRYKELVEFLCACANESWESDVAVNANMPSELKDEDERGVREWTVFFVLFCYQFYTGQFFGVETLNVLNTTILPEAERFLGLPERGLAEEYPAFADVLHHLFTEYLKKPTADDVKGGVKVPIAAMDFGKCLCILVGKGRQAYERWERLSPAERYEDPVDMGALATTYGVRYVGTAAVIGKFCQRVAQSMSTA